MDKLQKGLVAGLLVISLGSLVSAFKVGKAVNEKKGTVKELSLKNADLTKEGQGLKENLEKKESELAQTKLDLDDANYSLEEEKKKVTSLQERYDAEKEKADELESNLNRVTTAMEEETREKEKIKEELSAELENLKEEKEVLSRDLKEVREAKESLEAFVAEVSREAREEVASGKVIKGYPEGGLLAIELERGNRDRIEPMSLISGEREIKLSEIQNYMVILDAAKGEDLAAIKDGSIIKYKYRIREVAPGTASSISK